MKTRFTIIIPTYNNEKEISECLVSIANQTFGDFEVIVVDDGSTDSSRAVIEAYSNKYLQFRLLTQSNSGPNVARNHGISKAEGDYILFVDADDSINERLLEILNNELLFKKWDIINFGFLFSGKKNNILYKSNYKKVELFGEDILTESLVGSMFAGVCWNKCINRIFLTENSISFYPDRLHARDLLFTRNCAAKANNALILPDILYTSLYREGSYSRSFSDNNIISALDLCDKHIEFFVNKYSSHIDELVYFSINKHLRYIMTLSAFRSNNFNIFRAHHAMVMVKKWNNKSFGYSDKINLMVITARIIRVYPLIFWAMCRFFKSIGYEPY